MSSERRILVGLDFAGLAEFIFFLLVILALLVWIVYKLAAIILPSALIVLMGLILVGIPFLRWEQATIGTRAQRTIATHLEEIKALERAGVPREQIHPLERWAREAAQALADSIYSRYYRLLVRNEREADRGRAENRLPDANWLQRRQQQRSLRRELDALRLTHDVVPDSDSWRRVFHVLLQRGWFRWLVEHPRPGGLLILVSLILLLAAVAGALNEFL